MNSDGILAIAFRQLTVPRAGRAIRLFPRAGSLSSRTFGEFAVDISSPERAILEYLDGFPLQASFEEARQLLESLTTLRPEVLQSLLEACTGLSAERGMGMSHD